MQQEELGANARGRTKSWPRIPPGALDRAKYHFKKKEYPAVLTDEHTVRSFKKEVTKIGIHGVAVHNTCTMSSC